ncbi:CCA tRNA nucleotidyltransferase, mitochondrial [Microbotryomycetes sp. JL221]|nr:CCA tRNA nucleotidyltransferase, mitochondrial [Microbotryomycetes sp. JL221]
MDLPRITLTDKEQQLADLLVECADWVDDNPQEVDALRLRDENGSWIGKPRGREQVELRIAGGWVRDKLIGRASDDIDISTSPDPITGLKFATLFEKYLELKGQRQLMGKLTKIDAKPDQSKHLETATAIVCDLSVDWVQQRGQEVYTEGSRIPTVAFGTPLEDAERRDLTINALFYNLRTRLIEDQTGKGLPDLGLVPNAPKQIRTPLEPFKTFHDDPLRVIRAVRFAARFGRDYALNEQLVEAIGREEIRAALRDPKKISRERVGIELEKMLNGNDPLYAMELIDRLGLHDLVFLFESSEIDSFSNPGHPRMPQTGLAYQAAQVLASLLYPGPGSSALHPALQLKRVPVQLESVTIPPYPSETAINEVWPVTIKRLYTSCGLLPLYDLSCTEKKKVIWVGEKVVREGIKWPTHDIVWAKKAREATTLLSEAVRRSGGGLHEDSLSERGQIGRCSCPDPLDFEGGVNDPAAFASLVEAYNRFVDRVLAFGLDRDAFKPPLLDGKQINDLLPETRGSPAMTAIMGIVVEFQLRNPHASTEDCKTFLLAQTPFIDDLLSQFSKKPAGPKRKKPQQQQGQYSKDM